jgi:hypothetical protein
MRVRAAVRNMARLASFNLYRRMLKHEWPLFLSVTCKANRILRGRCPYLLGSYCAVHIVAVAALDQSFVYTVMERHFELGLLLQVA